MINDLIRAPARQVVAEFLTGKSAPVLAKRRWLGVALAVAADAIQIGLAPFFAEGVLSPFNMALDIAVAAALTWILGWHIAFLPGFLMEQVPFLDLAPTWTVAALLAARRSRDTHK